MTKSLKAALLTAVVGTLVTGGAGLRAGWEYMQAARAEVAGAVERNIPLSLELGRLKQLIGQLDSRIATDRQQLAEAEVGLDEARSQLADRRDEQQACLARLQELRTGSSASRTASVARSSGCGRTRPVSSAAVRPADSSAALRSWYVRYQRLVAAITARAEAAAVHQATLDQLAGRLEELTQERELLVQRVSTLEARATTQALGSALASDQGEGELLARAREVADRVERRLKVAERVETLSQSPVTSLAESDEEIGRNVDRLLDRNAADSPAL
jgi:chromosome segregation ATPase